MEYVITALGGVRPYFEVFEASNHEAALEYFVNTVIDTVGNNEYAISSVESGCIMLTVINEGGQYYFTLTMSIEKEVVNWMDLNLRESGLVIS